VREVPTASCKISLHVDFTNPAGPRDAGLSGANRALRRLSWNTLGPALFCAAAVKRLFRSGFCGTTGLWRFLDGHWGQGGLRGRRSCSRPEPPNGKNR